jgi:hypothetical protein
MAAAASAATSQITVTAPSTEQSTVGTAVSVQISATDSDSSATPLAYSASGLPAGLSIDSSTGLISGKPTGLAKDTVTVTVTDSTGAAGTASIAWQAGGNITISSTGGFGGNTGQTVNLPFVVHDNAAGDTLTYQDSGLPPGLHFDPADSLIVGWPTNEVRWDNFYVNGLDGGQGSQELGFTIAWPNLGAAGPVRLNLGGKCLDDYGDKSTVGNKVDAYSCNGSDAQNWTYAEDGSLQIHGMCLDVTGQSTAANATLDLATCNAVGNRDWDNGTGGQFQDARSGYCLTDPGSSTVNGIQLEITSCGGGGAREWTLPAETVHSAIDGRCLDDYQASTANGAKVDEYSCNGNATQNWAFQPDGTIRVNGKCLDDTGNGTAAGTKIELWSCWGGASQKWTVTPASNSLGIQVKHGSMCVSPTSFTAANGTQLTLESCATDVSYWHSW